MSQFRQVGVIHAPQTKVLVHADETEPVVDVINGHLIELPAYEPVELDPFIANAVLNHKGELHAIVEVQQIRSGRGVEYALDEAIAKSKKLLPEAYKKSVEQYVKIQMEDRIGSGRPALAPNGRPKLIIEKLGVSLFKQYGLRPVGWTDPGESEPYGEKGEVAQVSAQSAAQVATLQNQVNQLTTNLATLTERMLQMMDKLQKVSELAGVDDEDGNGQADLREPTTPSELPKSTPTPAPVPITPAKAQPKSK